MSKNDLGQRVRNQWEDGTFWDYQYDNLGQVVQGQKKFADGTPLNGYDYGYTFDDIGNRTQAMTNGRTESYTANSVNQYTQRNVSGAIDIVGWANPVDEVLVNNLSPLWQGNYFYKELPVSNSAAPVYQQVDVSAENPANVITTKSGKRYVPKTPEAFSYDDDGNLLSDRRWSYTWDGENRLVAMEAIASAPADAKLKLEFLYDWRGRRIRKTVAPWNAATSSYDAPTKTTKFIYDGWNLLAEVENGVLARSYIWGPDLSGTFDGAGGVGGLLAVTPAGENPQMVFSDGNGNVSMLADIKTGEVTAEYEYGPFGELVRSTGPLADENPFRFSSKYQDGESGLLYYGYRYYDAGVGRWVSQDTASELGFQLFSDYIYRNDLVLYNFVRNEPISKYDFLGLAKAASCRCGPEVTLALQETMLKVSQDYWALDFATKKSQCSLNRFRSVWDIAFPEAKGCGGQGSGSLCNNTVWVNGRCWNKWNVNYALFGRMNDLCGNSLQTAIGLAKLWKRYRPIMGLLPDEGYTEQLEYFLTWGYRGTLKFDDLPKTDRRRKCKPCNVQVKQEPMKTSWPDQK